jgi:hypothetical protein
MRLYRTYLRLLLLVTLLLPGTVAADPGEGEPCTVGFSPSTTTVDVGDTFSLQVVIDCIEQTRGSQATLSFDADKLRCDSVTAGTYYASWAAANGATHFPIGFPPTIDNDAGTVSNVGLMLIGGTGGPTGAGVLATCNFTALAPGEASVAFPTCAAADTSGSSLPTAVSAATVKVAGGAPPDQVVLQLCPGWNMVSVPVQAADMSTQSIFPGVLAVYAWNPQSKSYASPATIEPWRGYRVAVSAAASVTISGTPVANWTTGLSQGWNMIGSAYGDPRGTGSLTTDTTPDPLLRSAVYTWNPTSKTYGVTSSIEQGRGHWLAATAACQVTLSETA